MKLDVEECRDQRCVPLFYISASSFLCNTNQGVMQSQMYLLYPDVMLGVHVFVSVPGTKHSSEYMLYASLCLYNRCMKYKQISFIFDPCIYD